jgi:hypothetical protein
MSSFIGCISSLVYNSFIKNVGPPLGLINYKKEKGQIFDIWKTRKKNSKIFNDDICLPFCLLYISWYLYGVHRCNTKYSERYEYILHP